MARPKKETTKDERVSIACTKDQLLELQQRANQCGLSKSEYLLRCGLDRKIPRSLNVDDMDAIRKLTGMSNNLNQIAKKLNSMSPGEKLNMTMVVDLDDITSMIRIIREGL